MNRLKKYDLVYVGLTDEAFWLSTAKHAKAGILTNKGWKGSFIFSVEADEDRKGRVLKTKKIQNVSFYFFLIYFRYEILTVSILCSSFDYWTLAAYTYFSIWLNYLPVCCAYTQTCGSDFGFGCISYNRHCHSTGHVKDMWLLHYQCERMRLQYLRSHKTCEGSSHQVCQLYYSGPLSQWAFKQLLRLEEFVSCLLCSDKTPLIDPIEMG